MAGADSRVDDRARDGARDGARDARSPGSRGTSSRAAPHGEGGAPLRVALAGMSERTGALLRWHFEHARPRAFVETGVALAEAMLVDADHPDATASAEPAANALPLVVLALDPAASALSRRAAHAVVKPVSAASLAESARALRVLLRGEAPPRVRGEAVAPAAAGATVPTSIPPAPAARPRVPAPVQSIPASAPSVPANAADGARLQLRNRTLCGDGRSIDAAIAALAAHDAGGTAPLWYDPARHVGSLLAHAIALSGASPEEPARPAAGPATVGITIALSGIELFVLPELDRVYASATLRSIATVDRLFAPLELDGATVTHHSAAGMGALVRRTRERARVVYTLDAFTWLAALMSSRGRLPVGTDRTRAERLARWPNLTRLELVPHAMELASRWNDAPLSIEAMVRASGVHPRFVHGFHQGAHALDLFETRVSGHAGHG